MEVAAAMRSGSSGVEEEQRDVFDELPEAILLEIFNKINDAKSLCFCLCTCKRFGSLIPLTSVLHLTLPSPQRINNKSNHQLTTTKPICTTSTNKTNVFKSFINRVILTPVRFLLKNNNNNNIKKSPPCSHCDGDTNDDFHLPSQILKNFNEIRSLRIQLPRNVGDISNTSSGGIDKLNPLLKWNAKFGSQLQSCVILAAANSSFSTDPLPNSDVDDHDHDHQVNNNESSSYLSNEELKLRVVWTISCLIAASARHHMLKQIVLDHGSLQDAVISDGSNQGKISMDKAQVEDLRRMTNNDAADDDDHLTSSSSSMEELPALRMHMWYVPVLELPESGCVLNGATLVVIRPVVADSSATTRTSTGTTTTTSTGGGDDELLAMGAFDSDEREGDICNFREAVGKMIKKKRAYSLQMSPF